MNDEADVQREFLCGPLNFRDAVIALQKLGYDPKEADRIVSEWADDADHKAGMESDYDEQMGGY